MSSSSLTLTQTINDDSSVSNGINTVSGGAGCEDCNNTQDPISLDELKDIPSNCLFKVKEGQVTNCFDIRQLYQYYEKSKKLENPLTRTPFSDETLNRFLEQVTKLGIAKDNKDVQRATEMDQLRSDTEMLRDFLTRPMDDNDFTIIENVDWNGALSRRRRHRRSFQSDHHHTRRIHEEFVLNSDGTVTHSNVTIPSSLARTLHSSLHIDEPVRTVVRTIERTSTIRPNLPSVNEPRRETATIKETVASYVSRLPHNPTYNPPSVSQSSTSSLSSSSYAPSSFNARLAQEREDMLAASRARTTSFSLSTGPSASLTSVPSFQSTQSTSSFFHTNPLNQPQQHSFPSNVFAQPQYQQPFYQQQQQPVFIRQQPSFRMSQHYEPVATAAAVTRNEQEEVVVTKKTNKKKAQTEKRGSNWVMTFLLIALGGLLLMLLLPKIGSLFG